MKKRVLLPLLAILLVGTLPAQTISFADKEVLFAHPDGDNFSNVEFESPYLPCDYNNDGYVDFVGKRGFQEQLILKGTAVDTFQEINILPPGSPSARNIFDVLDFDQDGDEDFVAEKYILINEGDDVFSLIDLVLDNREFVAGVADFNGDNQLDLLIFNDIFFENYEISILTNNGDNTFTRCLIDDQNDDLGDTEIGDIDQDGDLDIVTSSSDNNGDILLFRNDGECQFSVSTLIYQDFTPLSERSLGLNDMNGDGKPDIIIAGFSSIFIFENTDGFVSEPPYVNITTGQNSFFNIVDFNNDDQADIAVVTRAGNFRIQVIENLGSMNFSAPEVAATFSIAPAHGTPDFNYFEQNMRLYDYDNNGAQDIIYTDGFGPSGSNNISLVLNTTVIVGVDDLFSKASDLIVFPNPTKEEINLPSMDINYDNTTFFQLANMKGQIVKEGYLTSTKIDISDLSGGQYFLRLNTGSDTYRSKFIKL